MINYLPTRNVINLAWNLISPAELWVCEQNEEYVSFLHNELGWSFRALICQFLNKPHVKWKWDTQPKVMSSQDFSEFYLLQSRKRYCTSAVETNNELWDEMIVSAERWIARHMGCDKYKGSHATHATATAISLHPRDERIDCTASQSQSEPINGYFLLGDLIKNVKWSQNWCSLVSLEFIHPLLPFSFGKWPKV